MIYKIKTMAVSTPYLISDSWLRHVSQAVFYTEWSHYAYLLLDHVIPCLDVSRMPWAARAIWKRIPVQRKAPHTQTDAAPVPRYATQ